MNKSCPKKPDHSAPRKVDAQALGTGGNVHDVVATHGTQTMRHILAAAELVRNDLKGTSKNPIMT